MYACSSCVMLRDMHIAGLPTVMVWNGTSRTITGNQSPVKQCQVEPGVIMDRHTTS